MGGFIASRGLAWALGVRFDATPLDYFWQYLDPGLLRDDLLASLFYQHSQPPAFNALLGVVLKLGGAPETSFALVFHAAGLATCLGVFVLATRLGVAPVLAGALAALQAASPGAVLYEHWLFYTHLVAGLLVWGAIALHTLLRSGRWRDALLLSFAVAAVACTRSLFHLVWVLALLGGTLVALRRARRDLALAPIALAMAPALLLVVALYAKNAVLFGSPASSTWLGMSLAKVSTQRLEPARREAMVEDGSLSPAARVKPFSPLSKYPRSLVAGPVWGHPALDRVVKPGNYVNFNHGAYVGLGRIYLADALTVVGTSPTTWLESFGLALLRYAIPPSQYGFIARNAAAYAPVCRAYELVSGVPEALAGTPAPEALGDAGYLLRRIPWLYWSAAVLALGWALARVRTSDDPAERATLLYALVNIAWVAFLANAVELGENQRFQVMVAPLQLVLMTSAAQAGWRRFHAKPSAALPT